MAKAKTKLPYAYEYPRPALTVDLALVSRELAPRVLLIQRKKDPFAGRWALPGGFVDEQEPLADAARRELREETGVEAGDLEQLYAVGTPRRDPRGWTVSVVFWARVDPSMVQPKAADDAAEVEWFPLDKLPDLAFDHADIVQRVCTRLADRAP